MIKQGVKWGQNKSLSIPSHLPFARPWEK